MIIFKIILAIIAILFLLIAILFLLLVIGCYNVGKEMHYYRSCGHGRSDL